MFDNAAKIILEISILSAVAIGAVRIIRKILGNRMKSRVMMFVWALVLIRLVMPVSFEAPVRISDALDTGQNTAAEAPQSVYDAPQSVQAPSIENTIGIGADTTAVETQQTVQMPQQAQTPHTDGRAAAGFIRQYGGWNVAFVLWLAGVLMFTAFQLGRWVVFRKRAAQCGEVRSQAVQYALFKIRVKLGLNKHVRVVECNLISVPAVMGVIKPVVLLPKEFAEVMDENQIEMIILHELCHVKRADLLKRYAWLMVRALHWFNPLVWLAFKAYMQDAETACDEMAARYLDRDGVCEYSQALVEVMKSIQKNVFAPISVSLCKDKSMLKKRVINMMKPHKKTIGTSAVALLLMCGMMLGCFTTACSPISAAKEQAAAVEDEAQETPREVQSGTQSAQPSNAVEQPQPDVDNVESDIQPPDAAQSAADTPTGQPAEQAPAETAAATPTEETTVKSPSMEEMVEAFRVEATQYYDEAGYSANDYAYTED